MRTIPAVPLSPFAMPVAATLSVLLAAALVIAAPPKLVLIGVAGVIAAFILATNPRRLWLLLIALLPFSIEVKNILGAGNHLTVPTEALAPIAALAIVFAVLKTGRLEWTRSALHFAVAFYLGLMAASLAWSEIPLDTVKALARTACYFVAGYMLCQLAVRKPSDLTFPLKLLAVATSLLVLYGLYTQFKHGVRVYQDIAEPFFEEHCVYAAWLCFPAAFALGALTQPIRYRRIILAFALLLSFGILLSFVRGAWIGMASLAVYLVLRQRSQAGRQLLAAIGLFIVIGLILVPALGLQHLFMDRWETLFDTRYVSNESRIDRWMAAVAMWKDSPIWGLGFGCYPDLYFDYVYYTFAYEATVRMGAHNLYLEILAELGILGLVAYLTIIAFFFRETRQLYRGAAGDPNIRAIALGLESMMVVYLIHTVVNNLGPSDKIEVAFWTTLGLAVSLRCAVTGQQARSASEGSHIGDSNK